MESPHTFEHIEAYLEGRLSEQERRSLEQQMATDAELARKVEHHRRVHEGLRSIARDELKAEIAAIQREMQGKVRPLFGPVAYRMAAAVLLLFVLGIGYWWLALRPTPERLFAQHFAPHELRLTHMGEPQQEEAALTAFRQAYEAGDFARAIEAGTHYLAQPDTARKADSLVLLGLGNACLAQGRAEEAVSYLEQLQDKYPSDLGRWYLGLAYLADGRPQAARQTFEALLADESSNFRKTEVQEILQRLK
ncbi:MAG: hypothetical protein D6730_01540 [Bacteroidetes bacterium]|nr:MAG: hypothetical protein D6730_01540 [Bacteroidota bacterium]